MARYKIIRGTNEAVKEVDFLGERGGIYRMKARNIDTGKLVWFYGWYGTIDYYSQCWLTPQSKAMFTSAKIAEDFFRQWVTAQRRLIPCMQRIYSEICNRHLGKS